MTLQLSLFASDMRVRVKVIFLSWSGVTILNVTEICVGCIGFVTTLGLLVVIGLSPYWNSCRLRFVSSNHAASTSSRRRSVGLPCERVSSSQCCVEYAGKAGAAYQSIFALSMP